MHNFIWAEYFSFKEALNLKVISLLKQNNFGLNIACFPDSNLADLVKLLDIYSKQNIEACLWILLPDKLGYWANESNAQEFSQRVEEIISFTKQKGVYLPLIAVDLETPFNSYLDLKNAKTFWQKIIILKKIIKENKNPQRFIKASEIYSHLLEKLHQQNIKTLVAVAPLVINDFVYSSYKIQNILETPISTINWDLISFMFYNSMNVGYSKGLINYADAHYLLYLYAKQAQKFLGDRASFSLGVTYLGKLGDEPYYKSYRQLIPDIAATKSAGIKSLGLYNLEGVLKRKNSKNWLQVFKNTLPFRPKKSYKAIVIYKLVERLFKVI